MELQKTISFYFRQPSLDSVGISELQKAITRFPYCASLHYLLLKKQKLENDPQFDKQANIVNLFFPNGYRLNTLLESPIKLRPETPIQIAVTAPQPVADIIIPKDELLPEPIEIIPVTPEIISVEEPAVSMHPEENPESPEPEIEDGPEPSLRTDLLMKESPIPIPSLKDISPQADDLPIFEPYHTIDYFASQGIKLSNTLPVNDRLGRQLKSFTDWIKTMKKLPQAEMENKLDEAGVGEKIVALAAGSVVTREVLTETMAEVLVKQGNISGAMEVYRKLSLAHPDKSAYFAARIELLKSS